MTTLAQPPAIFFDHITTKDGLSNNFVNAILKDRQGFLWIGTADGLNRYDSRNFVSFYHSIYNANSLPHNDVYSLFEDDNGYIWVGTFNGLCRINPATNEIKRITPPPNADSTGFFVIADVKQSKFDGIVWVATNKGLFWVNQKKDELVYAKEHERTQRPAARFITKILIEAPNSIWLGAYDGLLQYEPVSGRYTLYKIPSNTHIPGTLVKSLFMDKRGTLWLTTWGRGLQKFDAATKTFTRFLPQPELGERSDANILYNIAQTGYAGEDSILWIGADALGLLAFNMQTGKFKQFNADTETATNGLFGHAFSFCMTKNEGLWIGGSNGLYRYDPHHQLFRHVEMNKQFDQYCLKEVLSAYADPLDASGKTLLVSTWSCGTYRFNLNDGSIQPLPLWMIQVAGTGHINSFYRDADSSLWLATANNGLHRFNEKNKTSQSFYPPITEPGTNPRNVKLLADAGNGTMWLGTRNGIFVLNKQKGTVQRVFSTGFNAPADVSDEVLAFAWDKQQNLWFCTNLRQDKIPVVGKLAPNSLQPVLYYAGNGFPEKSPLQALTIDARNNVWVASWNGLVYWNAAEAKPNFQRLTRNDGLCNDKVFKVLADRQGYIWASTLRGISCYDPVAKTFRNYYANQGLHQDNIANFFKNEITGELIAGYEASLDIINPAQAVQSKEEPSIVITGLKVFNEPYSQNKKSYINKGLVLLAPGQNMVTINFSALSFTDSRDVRYAYKMQGVDKDWTITENDFVTYHNLPPGSRKLFVRARNAEGAWSSQHTWVEIDLAPPFYRTWWFIFLAVAIIAAAFYLIYRDRIRRLEEKFRIRSTIARDLHDEIGSTLTSINILSRVTHYNLEKDKAKAAGLLQKITEQSQDMQQSMSDIIWAIKPDNDKLENMAARMREYLSHTLEAKNIAINFEADEQVLKESLSMEQRKDFFLIFKETVNNAAKYAGSSSVTVKLTKEKNSIVLLVSDEGIGFDVTKKHSSNGLKNMQARAASLKALLVITSAPGKGTQVRLSIPTT
jgi:ligand-binding sensor domain-containing protein/signal transduction histidine kinase